MLLLRKIVADAAQVAPHSVQDCVFTCHLHIRHNKQQCQAARQTAVSLWDYDSSGHKQAVVTGH
jgi:hypothetical protein